MTSTPTTLADLGEFRLIDEVILPLARRADPDTAAGDDCAYVPVAGSTIAVSADVGPRPLIRSLRRYEDDWQASGWLAVVATASDIATAGAEPVLLTNCIDAPPDLPVETLRSFMEGYFSALKEFGFRNGGGDLRHGPTLAARVFGVGQVTAPRALGRAGARAEDRLVVVGPAGMFFASYILAKDEEERAIDHRLTDEQRELLRFPRPQLASMKRLSDAGFLRAASDTSDGLLGAIDNIGRSSKVGFHLELDKECIPGLVQRAAAVRQVASVWNIFFAWGDWSVACAVDGDRYEEFVDFCSVENIAYADLGKVTERSRVVTAMVDGEERGVTIVRNENFKDRGFNAGLDGHLAYILDTPLFT